MVIDISTYIIFASYCLLFASDKKLLFPGGRIILGSEIEKITEQSNQQFSILLDAWIKNAEKFQIESKYNLFSEVEFCRSSNELVLVFADIKEEVFFNVITEMLHNKKICPAEISYSFDLTCFDFSKERVIEEFIKGKCWRIPEYTDLVFNYSVRNFCPVTREDWHVVLMNVLRYSNFLQKTLKGGSVHL